MLDNLFLLEVEVTTKRAWGDVLKEFVANPIYFVQSHFMWIIVVLLVLFLLSRTSNFLEKSSVTRAINFSRGLVESFVAFVVAPIVFVVLINIIAYLNNLPMIDLSNIGHLLKLTATSFWWFGKCIFDGAPFMEPLYDGNSLVRLLAILLPISYIWLRAVSTSMGKTLLVPFIIVVFIVTKNRVAPDTFVTPYLKEHFPEYFQINSLNTDKISINKLKTLKNSGELATDAKSFYKKNHQSIGLFLGVLVFLAIVVGYVFKQKKFAAFLALGAIVLYFLVDKQYNGFWLDKDKNQAVVMEELKDKMADFEWIYKAQEGDAHIKLSNLAVEISAHLKQHRLRLPSSFCNQYRDYFYEVCELPPDNHDSEN